MEKKIIEKNRYNSDPHLPGTSETAQNPNPRANENIMINSPNELPENEKKEEGIGSEITDGEDA